MSDLTLRLRPAEVDALRVEIGDLPKKHVGPKLLELYRRLESHAALLAVNRETRRQERQSRKDPEP